MAAKLKTRYRVDFSRQMADCEANYARMMQLLPSLAECDQWVYEVPGGQMQWHIHIAIADRARYTTTLDIRQHDGLQHWNSEALLQVRLYHDAQVAEVLGWQQHRRVQPRYEYPNRQMYQCNEKAQINQFLGEWLSHCLAHGRSGQSLAALGLPH